MTDLDTKASPTPFSNIIKFDREEFPWWLVGMILIIAGMVTAIILSTDYNQAYFVILPGLTLTIVVTVSAFALSTLLGLILALMRMSRSIILRNISQLYVELVRGVPFIVFIFLVALVMVPEFTNLAGVSSRSFRPVWRGIAALSLFYGAFIAEVFRAGIQSVEEGQREAGRAVGLGEGQITRFVVLPQAIRNMLPALGNDLIALMKDTALLSLLAVREMTQLTRIYTGSTFKIREGFFVLTVFYVVLTLVLSLLLSWYEKRIAIPGTLQRRRR